MHYRPEIDGLRAVAVLPVVLFHAGVSVFSGGYVGVDVFFVISGFLITGLIKEDLDQGRFSILGFYNRRFRRILPALVFTVIATSIAAFWLLLPTFLVDYSRSLVSVGTFLSNFYFWQNSGYFDAEAQLRPMLHTWSLAVEEQFYIFMPIAAFLVHRFFGRRWFLIFGSAAVASLALSIWATRVGPTANFFLLPTRAWELLLGALLAVMPRREYKGAVDQVLGLAGLALIAVAVFVYTEATPFPGLTALPPCLGAALAIYFAHPTRTLAGRLLANPPMIAIGLISYSLYLVHWPIAVFWRYVTLEAPGLMGAAAISLVSGALAWFSWRFVERPFRKRGGASNLKVIVLSLVALAMIAGIGGVGLWLRGLPERVAHLDYLVKPRALSVSWRNGDCFFQDHENALAWTPEKCVYNPEGTVPTLLWGDSFAAHYSPGIEGVAQGQAARLYQYTAAGCPPVLSYYSYARPQCAAFNERALEIIDELKIRRVILAARWVDMRGRGEGGIRSTLDELAKRNVEVYVVGQSPTFITTVLVIAARKGGDGALDTWPAATDPAINEELRANSQGATFIDPMTMLCSEGVCPYRENGQFVYFDSGHFTRYGSEKAARLYLPLGPER